MASNSFPLPDRPWIPVHTEGRHRDVGLRELFASAHLIDDLLVPVPPAAAGLWRVLYAMTARITGLDDPESGRVLTAWQERRNEVLAAGRFDGEAVERFFGRFGDRFDLFGERPWLQDSRLAQQCSKTAGINKLVLSRPAGQNQVWFGHFTDLEPEPVPAAEAVWYLLVQLYYGPSGRCSTRTVGATSEANSTAGPLRSTVSYHPMGTNLFESLVIGVPQPGSGYDAGPDVCPWERETPVHPLGTPTPATWPCGMLTGRARHAVLLVPSDGGGTVTDAYITWAWRQPGSAVMDPYVMRRLSKDGHWYAHRADADRALWRDLDGLLLKADSATEAGVRRPTVFDTLDSLPWPLSEKVAVRAYGFDQDGQTRDRQWFTAVTPPVLGWLEERSDAAYRRIRDARKVAEDVARRLDFAMREGRRRAVSPPESTGGAEKASPCMWSAMAASTYWPLAERAFWTTVYDRETVEERAFVDVALDVVDAVVGVSEKDMPVARAMSWARAHIRGRRPAKAA